MKEFFLILFFAKWLTLTPSPIDINGNVDLQLTDPLKAITSGASIQIDVTSMINKLDKEGILEFRERLKREFPAGSIEASLFEEINPKGIPLEYTGSHQFDGESVFLVLYGKKGIPTNLKFTKLSLASRIYLKDVRLYWKNYKQ